MALSTEQANLILTINGTQAGNTLKDLRNQSRDLQRALEQTADPKEFARLTDELAKVNGKLREVRQSTSGVTAAMSGVRTEGGRLGSIFQDAFAVFLGGGLLGVVQRVTGSLLGFGKAGVQAASDFEQAQIAFTTMIGSSIEADKLIAAIIEKAAKTPFETAELIDYAKRLMAMGIETEKILPTMDALGNIAAGVGKEKLPQLVLAFGQVQTKTKLAGGELKQFTEAGVPLIAALAQEFKVADKEILKMVENGKVGFKDVEKAIFNMSKEGGKFEGLMEKQSKTVQGLFSTLKDNFDIFARNVFTGFANSLKPVMEGLSKFLNVINEGFKSLSPNLDAIAKATEKERENLFGLVNEATRYTAGSKERKAAIDVLIAQHPDFLKGLNAETVTNEQLRDRLKEVNQQYLAKAIAIAAAKKVEEALSVEKKKTDQLAQSQADYAATIVKTQTYLNETSSSYDVLRKKLSEKYAATGIFDLSKRDEIKGYILELEKYAYGSIGLSQQANQLSQRTNEARANEQKTLNILKQQYPELAAIFDEYAKAAEGAGTTAKKAQAQFAETADPKDILKAAKERQKLLKEQYQTYLEEAELYYRKESLINENAFLNKQKNESNFNIKELQLKQALYEAQIKLQQDYLAKLKKGSLDYRKQENTILETQKKLLETQAELATKNNNITPQLPALPLAAKVQESPLQAVLRGIQTSAEAEKSALQDRFKSIIFGELELANARLDIQTRMYAAQLKALEDAGKKETKQYKDIADAKKQTDEELFENKKRLKDLEAALTDAAFGLAKDALQAGIELLGMDERERKKHASAIKAFEIGQAIVSGVAEVQKIWALYAGAPGGQIIAGLLTASAALRTGVAVAKISKQKFERGGIAQMGVFGGRPHAAGGTNLYGDDGTQINVERDELFVVLNKRSTGMLQRLSDYNVMGGGVPFMAQGGVLAMNTTPVVPIAAGSAPVVNMDLNPLLQKIDYLTQTVSQQQTRLRAVLIRSELEEAAVSDTADRAAAAV